MTEPIPPVLAADWRSRDADVDEAAALELFARAFTDDVVFESSRLDAPLRGRAAVIDRLLQIRAASTAERAERSSPQRSGDSLRWAWTVGTAIEGMDLATFVADGRIERRSVFAGR